MCLPWTHFCWTKILVSYMLKRGWLRPVSQHCRFNYLGWTYTSLYQLKCLAKQLIQAKIEVVQFVFYLTSLWTIKNKITSGHILNYVFLSPFDISFLWGAQCSDPINSFHLLVLSLGDVGLQIESSKIRISSRPNLIIKKDLIPIPTTILYCWSRFWYKFILFCI